MPDLVTSTLDVILIPNHTTRTAATALVNAINGDLGTTYDTARLGQWRRGERSIPQPVQDWMLRCCISHVIESCGGQVPSDDDLLDRMAAMLCPPTRKE